LNVKTVGASRDQLASEGLSFESGSWILRLPSVRMKLLVKRHTQKHILLSYTEDYGPSSAKVWNEWNCTSVSGILFEVYRVSLSISKAVGL